MSEFVTLGNHISIQKGKAPLETGYSGFGAKPYLNPEYLRGRAGAELAKPGTDSIHVCDGETILLWDGSNAGEFFKAKAGLVASTMARITPSVCFNARYFFHVAKHAETYLKSQTNGTGIPHVDRELLEAIEVFCPEPAEQIRLAEVLDNLDIAIFETEAIISKLKAVKQGLLHDLLTRGIDANGELRPTQAEAPHLYKESEVGWIPKEWELSTVGEQFEIQLGKMLDSQKNSGVLKPYLGNKAVQWDKIDIAEIQQVPLSQSDLVRFRLQKGDLLVCEGGEVGRAAIWDEEISECYYQKALHRLRPIQGYLPRLMLEVLRYLMEQDALSEYISRTSIAHLTQEKLAIVPLPTPQVDEQLRMVTKILAARQRMQAEESQLLKFKSLKCSLMDDLLTGRVRVTPLLNTNNEQGAS